MKIKFLLIFVSVLLLGSTLMMSLNKTDDDYFEIETDDGLYSLPNPLSELNRLEMLYDEFLPIFNSIKNRIDWW